MAVPGCGSAVPSDVRSDVRTDVRSAGIGVGSDVRSDVALVPSMSHWWQCWDRCEECGE